MQKIPLTVQIFLPTGDPSGIRIAEITTSILRVIEVPRHELKMFLAMPDAQQVGMYCLVGGKNEDDLYIGQSGNLGYRINQHANNPDKQWDRAIVIVSMTQNLTNTHVLYLEALSIREALNCKRYNVLNGNNGQMPFAPLPLEADCKQIHQLSSTLISMLGYPMFEALEKAEEIDVNEIFYFKRSGTDARGYYTNNGFVVLSGSKGLANPSANKVRQKELTRRISLVNKGILEIKDGLAIFTQDTLFKTPSGAANALIAYPANGWTEWKNALGRTLHDVYRAADDE